MNKIRMNNETYVDVSKPLTKKTKKLLKNAKPAKKYLCYNLLWNKLSIGLWEFPILNKKIISPVLFNCSSYTKIGIAWKSYLFEIVWNKKI
jgi:hypothetical protein